MKNKLETIIKGLIKARVKTRAHFVNVKRQLSNQQKIAPPLNSDLIRIYRQLLKKKQIKEDKTLERLLRKREIRTLSGVAVVTVITKPYPCPGKCIYCPGEKGMPKSYLSNEPAVMRAILTKFDPHRQVTVRLKALEANGHPTDKVELIVLGGTWSAYPKKYQTWFIKRCFDALNKRKAEGLSQAQKWNEKAKHRCVGLTLETRPDMVNEKEVKRMRKLGCTRVELGVQSLDDSILKLNKRGHTVKQTIRATKLLKQVGFKVMYHMMLNLPGSTPSKDLKIFKKLFTNPNFQPDLLKIYPCVVTKDSKIYRWYRQGKYKPYSDKQLKNLLIKIKQTIPYYVRITRLIRDIPAESIVAGNKITNLRQLIQDEIQKSSQLCKCIRCREAGHQKSVKCKVQNEKLQLKTQKYKASDGIEYFLSIESKNRKILYAFLRLRINKNIDDNFIEELKGTALIRELHTYGQLIPLPRPRSRGVYPQQRIQHSGLGKKLMTEAEKIVVKKKGIKKIAIISGIGVREYYKKLGYRLEGTYMTKNL